MLKTDLLKQISLWPANLSRQWTKINFTIQTKILIGFLLVIVIMGGLNALFIFQSLRYQEQYDSVIRNIATANYLFGYANSAIDSSVYRVVAGKDSFAEGTHYQILDEVSDTLLDLKASTDSDKSKIKIDVILRTLDTLYYYVNLLGAQMGQGSTYDENLVILDNIRGVSDVLQDSIQDFMLFEVARSEQEFQGMRASFARWAFANLITLILVVLIAVLVAWKISSSIYAPIKKLHDVTAEVTRTDLETLIVEDTDELTRLGLSFDLMRTQIRDLLDAKLQEQENLKKFELRALQAQINPHFLYNTLDSIVWLAQSNKNAEAIELVLALSNFFRISLSKGKDWITLQEEIEHVRSYLTIQKIRYRDIIDYEIAVDEHILDGIILKLTLQPLVENAIYHGIKKKRGGGKISVQVFQEAPDQVCLKIEDDGVGFDNETLEKLRYQLQNPPEEGDLMDEGFGIFSVNRRIRLFYGRQYGAEVDSELEVGTRITLHIPYQISR